MSDNIQTNTAGQTPPCLRQKIDKTIYLIEVHGGEGSTHKRNAIRRMHLGQATAGHSPRLRAWETGQNRNK